jgi:ABC-type glutathione transport system ATPase component
MPLAMSRPWKHPNSGVYWLRKGVPEDLRALVGKREEKRSLQTRDPVEAKRRHAEALAEIEERWANLRAGPKALTEREAHHLAAVVHDRWLQQHADNPSQQTAWNVDEVALAITRDTRTIGDTATRVRAAALLEPFGLAPMAEESPFALSSRQQAFLGLACLEASDCALAVLDEPLLARDVAGRRMLDTFLSSWTSAGRGVVVISLDLDLIDAVSDRLIVLADGTIAFDGPVEAGWHSPAFGALGWPAPVYGDKQL